MSNRLLPSTSKLVRHYEDEGMTHKEIADLYGSSRQAVTLALKGHIDHRLAQRAWPFTVESHHKEGWLYQAISWYLVEDRAERRLSERERSRVTALLDRLEQMNRETGRDFVFDYDPDKPLGFYLRERRKDDPESGILAGRK